MWKVGIVDEKNGDLLRNAYRNLSGLPLVCERYRTGVCYDAVVIAESGVPAEHIRCGTVIIPGGRSADVEARCAISYGMSGNDTVTLAAAKERCTVSLRRDVIGFGGETVCRQDAVFDFSLPPEYALPIAALSLLCSG